MDLHDLVPALGILVPIIAIVMGIGISALAMTLDFKRRERLIELHHKERMAAIERGMDVPPLPQEFFDSHRGRGLRMGRADGLRSGLSLLFIGTAITVAMYYNLGAAKAMWGLIVVAVGLARLVAHLAQGRDAQPPGSANAGPGDPA